MIEGLASGFFWGAVSMVVLLVVIVVAVVLA